MSGLALQLDPPGVIVRPMITLDRAADDFLGDCRRRRYSERTLTTYRRTYYELADRLPFDTDVSKITTDDLRRYLATKAHLAPGTVATHEAHLSSLFKWLLREGKIGRDPMAILPRTRREHPVDLNVKTLSPDEVRALLEAADSWSDRLALYVLAYLGPRRHAVAGLRLSDYDVEHGLMRFREKGQKTVWKPVPEELASLIAAARAAGVFEESLELLAPDDLSADPYLVPPEAKLFRASRDDRVIWRIVKRVAARAGIDTHVHALRAAFAVFYEELNPGDTLALRDLLGHRTVQTTEIYLRRRDKQAGMEKVRTLSWGVARTDSELGQVQAGSGSSMLEANTDSGGGRIRTSVGYPSRLAKPETAKVGSRASQDVQVLSAEDAERAAARERVAGRGWDPETCLRLVGLAEGEGCFYIARMGKGNWRCGFSVKLRADDRPLLDALRGSFRLGRLFDEKGPSRFHPCVRWEVARKGECRQLADVFVAYPLRSKKARDFSIWSVALDEWALIQRTEKADWSRIEQLAHELREVRKFNLTRDDIALLDERRARAAEAVPPKEGTRPSVA